jgi:hypothetical protein
MKRTFILLFKITREVALHKRCFTCTIGQVEDTWRHEFGARSEGGHWWSCCISRPPIPSSQRHMKSMIKFRTLNVSSTAGLRCVGLVPVPPSPTSTILKLGTPSGVS